MDMLTAEQTCSMEQDLSCCLERFLSNWKDDPARMSRFVGRAVGRIGYRHFDELCLSISTSYFSTRQICGRIQHLLTNYNKPVKGDKGKEYRKLQMKKQRSGGISIYDKETRVTLTVEKDDEDFAIRATWHDWEFQCPHDIMKGVIAHRDVEPFLDFRMSKKVADMVVLASNVTGFRA